MRNAGFTSLVILISLCLSCAPDASSIPERQVSSLGGTLYPKIRSVIDKQSISNDSLSVLESSSGGGGGGGVIGGGTGISRRSPNVILVYYYNDIALTEINGIRAALRSNPNQALFLSNGTPVNGPLLLPTHIDPALASQSPPLSSKHSDLSVTQIDCAAYSRYLAANFNLTIEKECYHNNSVWCKFSTPSSVDERTLAQSIISTNHDFVYSIEGALRGSPGYYPRHLDSKLDDISPYGYGITPQQNGMSKWNYGESYGYFQSKTHLAHCSFFGGPMYVTLDGRFIHGPYRYGGPGGGCSVFMLDTGFVEHETELPVVQSYGSFVQGVCMPVGPDSQNPIPGYWDLTPEDSNTFVDDYGHGCWVAGLLGAAEDNGGVIGGLPHGKIYPFKISEGENADTEIEYCQEAIDQAFDLRHILNCYVANVSFSYWSENHSISNIPTAMAQMAENIKTDDDFLIVTCAYNHNVPVLKFTAPNQQFVERAYWPAAFAADLWDDGQEPSPINEHVVSVMAVRTSEDRCGFSNFEHSWAPGSVTISAPGGNQSLFDSGILTTNQYGGYDSVSGTSFASPIAAASAAMIRGYREMSAGDLKAHLLATARSPKWDGSSRPGDVKKYLNSGNAMPWIDITSPNFDPSSGIVPTLQGEVTLTARVHKAPFAAISDNYYVLFFFQRSLTNDVVKVDLPRVYSDSGADPDFHANNQDFEDVSVRLYSVTFNTADLPSQIFGDEGILGDETDLHCWLIHDDYAIRPVHTKILSVEILAP